MLYSLLKRYLYCCKNRIIYEKKLGDLVWFVLFAREGFVLFTNLPNESVNENIVINLMKNNEQCSFENANEILTSSLKETSCIFVSNGWLCSAPLFELF